MIERGEEQPDSLSLSLSLCAALSACGRPSTYTMFRPCVTFFSLWAFSRFFFFLPFPFNSLRVDHPSLMSTSRSIGRCFCRSTNTVQRITDAREADTDLLDTLQPLSFLFFSLSLSLSSVVKDCRIPLIGESRSLLRGYTDRMQDALRIDGPRIQKINSLKR